MKHLGSCHCKQIQFEVIGKNNIQVLDCSCSICSILNYKHYVVDKSQFKLLKGKKYLSTYTFNTKVAKHMFCKICGIKSFYIPRSHPDSISINLNCINSKTINKVKIIKFDGKHWKKNINKIKSLRN
ncbi:MAG: aldehyde-activating protein [Alphaproteobacteria bacterium]|nr:aldehyde-activating protein [Alphaproteobacteria bacterium]RCL83052.1 MAG: GFA family protein [Alphaproteobacteria bacterium]